MRCAVVVTSIVALGCHRPPVDHHGTGSRVDAAIDAMPDAISCTNTSDAAVDLCANTMKIDLNGTTVRIDATVNTCTEWIDLTGCAGTGCAQTAVVVITTHNGTKYPAYFGYSPGGALLSPLNVACTGCPDSGGSPQSGCGFNPGGLQVLGICNLAVQVPAGCGSVELQFTGFSGL